MNEIAKDKINMIEDSLNSLARHNCPKYLSCDCCEDCDIECPFDQLYTVLRHIKKGDIITFTTTDKLIAEQNKRLGVD